MTKAVLGTRNRHDVRLRPAQVEQDAGRLLDWLKADPLRTLSWRHLDDWRAAQTPPWTHGYCSAVRKRVAELLRPETEQSAADVRAKLLDQINGLLPLCRRYRTGPGPSTKEDGSTGTVVLKDPVTGELLTETDHRAVQGYMRLVGELTGVLSKDTLSINATGPIMVVTGVPRDSKPRAIDTKPD